jgi:lon-related putative ATP-dependent protease
MTKEVQELSIDKLRNVCDPDVFNFKSTEELAELDDVIGQDRAVRAASFGIDIESPGYHMYALGPTGTGRTTTIRKFLEGKGAVQPVPDDWLYVNNFDDPDRPQALRLPAGQGCKFKGDMDRMVEDLQANIPNVFESEDYEREQEQINEKFQKRRQALFEELEAEAMSRGFTLLQTPRGIIIAPVVKGDVLSPEDFSKLDEETRRQLEERQKELQDEMRETIRRIQGLQQEAKEEILKLDRQVVGYAVEHLIDQVKEKYTNFKVVTEFLDKVREDLLENVEAFKQAKELEQAQQQLPIPIMQPGRRIGFDQYRVNLIVDNCETQGAPVILERNPTYANLVGRVEQQAQFGALVTDFRMIKSGALHQANGGYLMLEAKDVLTKPLAWDGLKRALKDGEIQIESMGEALGYISTRSLDPEPIPLDVKVILVGEPLVYYLLYNLDDDFMELFKVKVDFAEQMNWSNEALDQYARFIGTLCREESLRHFDPSGVARIIEQSARMVAHQKKLATRFGDIVDLIRQASYWAGKNGNELVSASDVKQAVDEQVYRSNRLEELIQELIEEGTLLIDTEGEVSGQVNGIAVLPMGDYAFGKPSRITARTHVGSQGVINIERESKLGGRIHNKGVLILSGYLGGKFADNTPMAFSASLTFEQSYEEVDGDSASSAELYALLSSLSGIPIRQDLAVTGSVNQMGQVQAIGGVNEKIEGFYEVCKSRGLSGKQGVIIPHSNVKHLMLRDEVVEAVKAGKFHVYPVSTIEEGIELLTGIEAGELDEEGNFPQGTVFSAVQKSLSELAQKVKAFSQREKTSQDGRGELEEATT